MSMRMGYECECESENVHEFEPNTRTAPCRGCQVHSFVSRSSTHRNIFIATHTTTHTHTHTHTKETHTDTHRHTDHRHTLLSTPLRSVCRLRCSSETLPPLGAVTLQYCLCLALREGTHTHTH